MNTLVSSESPTHQLRIRSNLLLVKKETHAATLYFFNDLLQLFSYSASSESLTEQQLLTMSQI